MKTTIQNANTTVKACTEHGQYNAKIFMLGNQLITTNCPTCQIEKDEKKISDTAKINHLKAQLKTTSILKQAAIPNRFLEKNFKNYITNTTHQKIVLENCHQFAQTFQNSVPCNSLVFLGNSGTGKTHLACAIATTIIKHYSRNAIFTSVAKIDRRIREAKICKNETERSVIDTYASCDLLIIDEVGMQSGTNAESRALFDITNERYERMKPMILISNLDMNGIKNALGSRIFDRISEGAMPILFNWESAR